MKLTDAEYRDSIDPAMEELCAVLAILGVPDNIRMSDAETIELASKKLTMLYKVAKQFVTPELLKIMMES